MRESEVRKDGLDARRRDFPLSKSSVSLDGKLRALAFRRVSSPFIHGAPRMAGGGRAKEGKMISTQEHVTMATLGAISEPP